MRTRRQLGKYSRTLQGNTPISRFYWWLTLWIRSEVRWALGFEGQHQHWDLSLGSTWLVATRRTSSIFRPIDGEYRSSSTFITNISLWLTPNRSINIIHSASYILDQNVPLSKTGRFQWFMSEYQRFNSKMILFSSQLSALPDCRGKNDFTQQQSRCSSTSLDFLDMDDVYNLTYVSELLRFVHDDNLLPVHMFSDLYFKNLFVQTCIPRGYCVRWWSMIQDVVLKDYNDYLFCFLLAECCHTIGFRSTPLHC